MMQPNSYPLLLGQHHLVCVGSAYAVCMPEQSKQSQRQNLQMLHGHHILSQKNIIAFRCTSPELVTFPM